MCSHSEQLSNKPEEMLADVQPPSPQFVSAEKNVPVAEMLSSSVDFHILALLHCINPHKFREKVDVSSSKSASSNQKVAQRCIWRHC